MKKEKKKGKGKQEKEIKTVFFNLEFNKMQRKKKASTKKKN